MALSYVQPGDNLNWTNDTGSSAASGAVVRFGTYGVGIVQTTTANGAAGVVATEGVHKLAKVSGTAFTQGQRLFWDVTNSRLDSAVAANHLFVGYAAEPAASGATTAKVLLAPFADEGTRYLSLSATTTLTVADFVSGHLVLYLNTQAGAFTTNLPSVADVPIGARFTARRAGTGTNAATLDPAGSELINGGATYAALDAANDVATFVSTGAAWVFEISIVA